MSRHHVIRRLELMWKGITIAARIDPFVEEVLQLIPNDTIITWRIQKKGITYSYSVRKKGLQFTQESELLNDVNHITFHTDSPHVLHQVLTARLPLANILASKVIKACGSSSIIMALVQVNRLSSPYMYGMRRARIVFPHILQPLNYPKRRFIYLVRFLTAKGAS